MLLRYESSNGDMYIAADKVAVIVPGEKDGTCEVWLNARQYVVVTESQEKVAEQVERALAK